MPELIAVRRNLPAGAVFYVQQGATVYYSLDRVNWSIAWTFPDYPKPQAGFTDSTTINNVFQMTEITQSPVITVTNVIENTWGSSTSQARRNLCGASLAAAVVFLSWLDAVNENKYDANASALANFQAVVAGIAGIIAAVAAPLTGGGSLALYAGIMTAGFGAGAALSVAVADMDNVADQTNEETLKLVACAIRDAMVVSGAGRTAFKNALQGASGISAQAADAFASLVDALPQMYSTFLTMVVDAPSQACVCDGCEELKFADVSFTNGIILTGNRLLSRQHRTLYLPSNWKYLTCSWSVPTCQVDSVSVETLVNAHVVQSGLSWGTNWFIACTISGDYNQSATLTLAPPDWSTGHRQYDFDFTPYTLAHGVNAVTISYRVVYASTPSGHASLDPTAEVSFLRAEYCVRG